MYPLLKYTLFSHAPIPLLVPCLNQCLVDWHVKVSASVAASDLTAVTARYSIAGWGTTPQSPKTCRLAPKGSYSPGGLIDSASTRIQACVKGTTNTGTGNKRPASCNLCLPGTDCGIAKARGSNVPRVKCLIP
jgi:hypothetical protein